MLPTTEEALTLQAEELLAKLGTSARGLDSDEVAQRLETFGYNRISERERTASVVRLLLTFRNPLVIILLIAGALSGLLGQIESAVIIFSIITVSVLLTFYQESKASRAAELLRERVATTASVMRDNNRKEIHLHEVVPGDIVSMTAGDVVPADCRLLTGRDLFVDQAAITGESYPAEKAADVLAEGKTASLSDWTNYLLMGTSVIGGTGTAVVVKTGAQTEFGKVAKRIAQRKPETEFERGLRRFGFLIMEVTSLLVIFVFFVLALKRGNVLESILFSVALAVGLTPELLPMIVTVNLAKGALAMSRKGVIVKRLSSIQNFGNMDVLCTDKTGTLTQNKVEMADHIGPFGDRNEKVFLYAFLNSHYETGLRSPLDDAILMHKGGEFAEPRHKEELFDAYRKVDEIPFDFTRKRVSVAVEESRSRRLLVTKGAPENILEVCATAETGGTAVEMTRSLRQKIDAEFEKLGGQGLRVLGVAYKPLSEKKEVYALADESDMVFVGFVTFTDPPKTTARSSIKAMKKAGIDLKIVTGDNEHVTRHVCEQLHFEIKGIVLGNEISEMHDDALAVVVERANIFARVTPAQKDRVISALRRNGHVVGFLGDGINDAPSMRISDVSISVNNAVDVAKESADIILLDKKLRVLHDGVLEGRKTFGNTMKYVLMAISSNFGNMFSAAGAALFLPFLPMLPIQVLLNNLLYDFSELAIPTDNVDEEYLESPKRLDVSYIRNFMVFFGPLSSIFDFLTFYVLIVAFDALHHETLFQTAWFVESLATQTLVIFAIRTRRSPFWKSRPGRLLIISSLIMVAFAILLPFTPIGELFQFTVPPAQFFMYLAVFIVAYLAMVEVMKRWFYRRYGHRIERFA